MSQPQIMWILENVYLSKGNVTTLKVYDMFVEAESMIVEITPAFQNGFAHIFAGGYAAGYYSYKWAEVLSADAFFAVTDEGIFNSKTAQKYYDIILKNGGAKSMSTLFKDLLHRKPDVKSLLRLNGIDV